MTPKVKKSRRCLSAFLDGTGIYISWPNLVKIGSWEVAEKSSGLPHKKNSGSSGLVRSSPPFCPRLASLKTSVFAPANKTQVGLRRGPYSTANVGRVGKSLTDRCLFRSATQRASYSTLRLYLQSLSVLHRRRWLLQALHRATKSQLSRMNALAYTARLQLVTCRATS